MFKIPNSTKKFSITNQSDTTGNIWYTKNVDFNEEGIIKLSSRAVQVISDSSLDIVYDIDFNIASSIGRYGTGSTFYIASNEEPFKATLSQTSFTAIQDVDSGVPSLTSVSRGKWWQNRWYVTTATKLYYKTISGGAWTDTSMSLTSGVVHPIEVFRSKTYMAVGNGNTVILINTSHSTQVTLTLPSDYEVVNMSYSGSKLGIITKLSATAVGQNQDAFFYVWDGSSGNANTGYPVNINEIVSITPYKGSWVILSKTGQLLYFNGGGFEEIACFPFFPKDRIWDSSTTRGDIMLTDGDLIYINIDGVLNTNGIKQESNILNMPGGIWCYDPDVGLYHKWSPSISQLNSISVDQANVNTTTDLLTITSGTIPVTGSPIKLVFSTSSPIGGLNAGQIYYVIKVSGTTFRLANSKTNAIDNQYIDLTSTGASVNYFLTLVVKDYGQSYLLGTGAIATTDTKNIIYDGLVFSMRGSNSVGTFTNYFGVLVSEFDNIGYFVTPRLESEDIEDNYQKLFIKYRPLKTNDTITIKYKDESVVGIPVSTPQKGQSCTWTSNTVMTFTGDLSEVETYLTNSTKACEVEIISGAGAGQMSQISTITENAGTYTITLVDEIEGVSASDTCNIKIENWKVLDTITVNDTKGYKEIPIANTGKFTKIKTIMKGTEIAIEELQVVNRPHLKSV